MSKSISNKQFLCYLLLLVAAFVVASYNPFITKVNNLAKMPLLDITMNYTPAYAYSYLDSLGTEGRTAYTCFLLVIDTAFPIAYSIFGYLILSFLLLRITNEKSAFRHIRTIPLIMGALDLMQNAFELMLLYYFPVRVQIIAQIASAITIAKMNAGLVCVISILVASGILIVISIMNTLKIAQSKSGNKI